MIAPYSKLEIDVTQINELNDAVTMAYKRSLPAIVVHPNLINDAILAKGKIRGRFKIITAIDWPKGENFSCDKFKNMAFDSLETDGFEIMLSYKDGPSTAKETHELTRFIKDHLSEQAEIRFVFGSQSKNDDEIRSMCENMRALRTPALLRNDINIKTKTAKTNNDVYTHFIELVREYLQTPIKLSGNIIGIKTITSFPNIFRFGVNVSQAKTIIDEFSQQPSELFDILNQ